MADWPLPSVQKNTTLNIGFDDTDSPKGMCTTYLAYMLVDSLRKEKVEFVDYPRLIRFNPNIPWKTRGNGAVSMKIRTSAPAKIKRKVIQFVKNYSDTGNGANPGVVFFENDSIPKQFSEFSKNALWKLISRSDAKRFIEENNLESFHIGNGQGLVGAIGAIGYMFADHTFELLSYRRRSQFGKKRRIVGSSVQQMQDATYPQTFNSYDTKKGRVLFAPHGPDPVFFGIRGENIDSLLYASKLIKADEKPVGHLVFKSNQGTGDHLRNELDTSSLGPYLSGTITGKISKEPRVERGGHVNFAIAKEGAEVSCYVYRPTGITRQAMGLIKGDLVRVGGGVRRFSAKHGRTLNVEFLEILRLEPKLVTANPMCAKCSKRMKSKGKGQGFECIKCGSKATKKETVEIPRQIKRQLYLPQVSAHRHLTRPYQRIGVTNKKTRFDGKSKWFLQYRN